MRTATFFCATLAASMALASMTTPTWADVQTTPVQFKKGESAATIKGKLKGDQTIDYSLRAKAGQVMTVSFKPSNASAYFNVLPPGSTGEAIFIGSSQGNEWTGTLPADGEYKVRTYLMRNAARRNETSNFTLTVGIAGHAASVAGLGTAPSSDAKVKGTVYHATGKLPCSAGQEPAAAKQCEFGVIRGAAGNAEVHVTYPGAMKQVLNFSGNTVTGDGRVKASKTGDIWSVEINEYEHYQIPEAVISGG